MQKGFSIDLSICMGCYSCVAACKNWNGVEPDVTAKPGTKGPMWRRVTYVETGKWPNAQITAVSLACQHCEHPPCLAVCPVSAISKRPEDGVVVVDSEKCIGCKACATACPFGAPQFGTSGKMQKCEYCLDRTTNGQEPACVATCPSGALKSGTMEELSKAAANKIALKLVGASVPSLIVTK